MTIRISLPVDPWMTSGE